LHHITVLHFPTQHPLEQSGTQVLSRLRSGTKGFVRLSDFRVGELR